MQVGRFRFVPKEGTSLNSIREPRYSVLRNMRRMDYKGRFGNDSEQGFNDGGGIRCEIGNIKLKVDYSNISFGVLNSVNMFSIGFGL